MNIMIKVEMGKVEVQYLCRGTGSPVAMVMGMSPRLASYALSRDMWMPKVTPQFEPRQPSSRVVREITCPYPFPFAFADTTGSYSVTVV